MWQATLSPDAISTVSGYNARSVIFALQRFRRVELSSCSRLLHTALHLGYSFVSAVFVTVASLPSPRVDCDGPRGRCLARWHGRLQAEERCELRMGHSDATLDCSFCVTTMLPQEDTDCERDMGSASLDWFNSGCMPSPKHWTLSQHIMFPKSCPCLGGERCGVALEVHLPTGLEKFEV